MDIKVTREGVQLQSCSSNVSIANNFAQMLILIYNHTVTHIVIDNYCLLKK